MRDKLELRKEMKDSYLIQRLEKPRPGFKIGAVEVADNPFSFGGGYRNGGLTKDAMNVIRPIFSFDYMGAAEFEYGAVPAALHFISNSKLAFGSVVIKKKNLVYYICPAEYEEEVKKRLPLIHDHKIRTKEYVGLDTYFERLEKKEEPNALGWLEIDNGWMFFGDKDMWEKMKALLGIQ